MLCVVYQLTTNRISAWCGTSCFLLDSSNWITLIATIFSFKTRRDNKKTIKPNNGMPGSANHDFFINFWEFKKNSIGYFLFSGL